MPCRNLEPEDDPTISCQVRLWKGSSVHVFVSPKEWKKVSVVGGTWMWITCNDVKFTCRVANVGEHYRSGRPKDVQPSDFGVPPHGDYPAAGTINWSMTIPGLVKAALDDSQNLCDICRTFRCDEMRSHLNHIFRARNTGAVTERQLALVRELSKRASVDS